MKLWFHVLVVVMAASLPGCVNGSASLDMVDKLPVYNDAFDIDTRKLGVITNQQLTYKVKQPYPSTEVLVFYAEYFAEHGWEKCTGDMEEWQSFIDATSDKERLIHQIAYYFVNERGMMSTVFLRYSSDAMKGEGEPENDIQNVFVLMQKNMNFHEALHHLSVSCP